jgi:thioredoxin-related protein
MAYKVNHQGKSHTNNSCIYSKKFNSNLYDNPNFIELFFKHFDFFHIQNSLHLNESVKINYTQSLQIYLFDKV